MVIGIPRGLFYYLYFPLWKSFFENLGCEVVISSRTNKKIMEDGLKNCVDDACLPVKVFHGHVMDLKGKCDYIYIPRIISTNKREYICPKFMGLPDMVYNSIEINIPIIDDEIDLYKSNMSLYKHFYGIGQKLGKPKKDVIKAFLLALHNFKSHIKLIKKKQIIPYVSTIENSEGGYKYNVLLLGHPYNIYDEYISMNLIKKLSNYRVKVLTPDVIDEKEILKGTSYLKKKLFWTLEKNIVGSAFSKIYSKEVDGIIYVASFGCGPDSIIGDLLKIKIEDNYEIPFLQLNLDEHSGQAGFDTRLEAFIDILERRQN